MFNSFFTRQLDKWLVNTATIKNIKEELRMEAANQAQLEQIVGELNTDFQGVSDAITTLEAQVAAGTPVQPTDLTSLLAFRDKFNGLVAALPPAPAAGS